MSRLSAAWADRRARFLLIGLAALIVAGVLLRVATGGGSSSNHDDEFFRELATSSALTRIDDTAISDETFRQAGHSFCDDLDQGRAAPADFQSEIDIIASRFFGAARRLQAALPYSAEQQDSAPAVVAEAVGTAAVHAFCPSHARALN